METCIPRTWYLACDMQFFLITPLIVYFYCKNWRNGYIITLSLILLSGLTAFTISYIHGFSGSLQLGVAANARLEDLVYIKPWCRFGAYGVGGLFGFGYFEYKSKGKVESKFALIMERLSKSPLLSWILLIIGILLLCLIVFIMSGDYFAGEVFWP